MIREVYSQRVFIAIKIYPDTQFAEKLRNLKQQLAEEPIRWVKPENYHVTIRYIGDCDSLMIRDISAGLAGIVRLQPSFDLTIKELGVFRSLRHPRVLWAGIETGPGLYELRKEVDLMLNLKGFKFEADNFSPHLTLGRMKKIIYQRRLSDLIREYKKPALMSQVAESVVFFESIPGNGGAEYFPLSEHFFNE